MNKWLRVLIAVLSMSVLAGCSGEGSVEITSRSAEGAEIYIDGDLKGYMASGAYEIMLSEGKHDIELIYPISDPDKYDQYYAQKSIVVADKSSQSIRVSLSPRQSPGYKEQWEEKQRKQMEAALALIAADMVTIPSGSFKMGSNEDSSEKPIHNVQIKSFKMGKYEVTQAQWKAVMGSNLGSTPSNFRGDNRPVEQVSWNDIQRFLGKLNKQSGKTFRLPSEAEWEYAARAGTSSKWSWGNSEGSAGSYVWYDKNSGSKTHPVGQKKPNAFGLYDMHGNVWEWVQDNWHDSYRGAPSDGSVWGGGDSRLRVLRGGSWYDGALRSAHRYYYLPGDSYGSIGFRLVRQP